MPSARHLLLVTAVYTAFVIYGSLVPLNFQYHSWEAALEAFRNIPYLDLGVRQRADWIANIVLYVPLSFLWLDVLARSHKPALSLATKIVLVLFASIVLAVGIEFAQIYFPPRTVSLNDLVAETIGTGIGILLWQIAGRRLDDLWAASRTGGVPGVRAALILYLLAYLALSFFPYDFVVSMTEFSEKLATGHDSIFLATKSCGPLIHCGAKLAGEVAALLPVGVLLGILLGTRRSLWIAALAGCVLGAIIEGIQLFIESGSAQGISVLTRGAGAMFGMYLYGLFLNGVPGAFKPHLRPALLLSVLGYLIALTVLNGWYTSPWLGFKAGVIRIADLHFLPFYYYYYTSESMALVSLLLNMASYLPVGLALWGWDTLRPKGISAPGSFTAAALGAILASLIEGSKLFLAGHRPDPTNVLIAAAAAGLSYILVQAIFAKPRIMRQTVTSSDQPVMEHSPAPQRSPLRTLGALLIVAGIAAAVVRYPLSSTLLAVGLFCHTFVLLRYQHAWLIVLPALLPVLDFDPWSGWFFFDEFDLFVLATFAVYLWTKPKAAETHVVPKLNWIIALLGVSYLISLVIGLFPLSPLDANAFSNYYSHYNALRVAKGFVWAVLLVPLLRSAIGRGMPVAGFFTAGMVLGLAGVGIIAAWERLTFSGLFNFSTNFRITSTFSTMNTGGGHIEVYLATALPFAVLCAIQARNFVVKSVAILVFILGAYTMMVTFSRAGYIAFAVSLAVMAIAASLHVFRGVRRGKPLWPILSVLLLATVVAAPILKGTFAQSRFEHVSEDMEIRTAHWKDGIRMMGTGLESTLFGVGLGRYPETYYWKNHEGITPATYLYLKDGDNTYLRLSSGDSLYMGQRVDVQPGHRYRLVMDIRSTTPGAGIDVPICEKSMLYSYDCTWPGIKLMSGNGTWEHHEIQIESGKLGSGSWLTKRPMTLSLYNSQAHTYIDVDKVGLMDEKGEDLLKNGDFERGNDHWLFTTDNHLPWHIKNVWLEVLFEQGWFGLALFAVLIFYVLLTVAGAAWRGRFLGTIMLASVGGFLTASFFDSSFDAPRLTMLFFTLAFFSLMVFPAHPHNKPG